MLVLARGGALCPTVGFLDESLGPTVWYLQLFRKKKNDKCPGEGGMGTLGIAWTIIDQAEGQDGWILAKFVCPFLWTESRAIDSHLDRISLVNKRF